MEAKQKVRISVRNLVEFILRAGDIDDRKGGFGEKEAMQEGSRLHRKIQGKMGANYQAEIPLSIDLPGEDCVLTIEGRADGIFTEKAPQNAGVRNMGSSEAYDLQWGTGAAEAHDFSQNAETAEVFPDTYIDEIKCIYRDVMSLDSPVMLHLAQAKCYAYIYGKKYDLTSVGVQMTYCNIETEEIRRFRQAYQLEVLERWFLDLAGKYLKWAKLQIAWRKVRESSIRPLAFPFSWRSGQKEVASSVYRTILRRKNLFIQAPTGTGKTISTIYPAVKAVGEGLADRIFYATAKTITRTVAEETFGILRKHGLRMKTVTLTAKEKICFLEQVQCNPEACPYAKGHFDRVNDAVYELLSSQEVFDRAALEAHARRWMVCPFEMELDVALWSDGIICDYNYIFDPRAKLKRFFGEGIKGAYLFLIDEAHNLVERGREMFSASLYKEDFLALKKEVQPYSRKLSRALNRCNTWLLERRKECETEKGEPGNKAALAGSCQKLAGMQRQAVRILETGDASGGLGVFPVYLMNLCGLMEEFLENSKNAQLNQEVLQLYFQVRRFLDTCDHLSENYVVYTEQGADGRFLLRLFCVDISENLQECLDRGRSTIYFSATFLPIQYYRSLLSARTDDYAIYAHPTFDPAKRLVLIGTDVSSRYTRRTPREYRRMAEYVLQLVRARRGNYMVFFSSYQMMDDVADQFEQLCAEQGEEILLARQMTGMCEEEREVFLEQFEFTHEQGFAGFCVMGGIFGEGIDLRRDRLIGAVVVGTGLPQICNEREILKFFYDRRGEDGFFYAYLCPGMNKVLQSAGRVIRTEEDEGVILLLDERFAAARYRSMFPAEWERPGFCTLQTVKEKAGAFWDRAR